MSAPRILASALATIACAFALTAAVAPTAGAAPITWGSSLAPGPTFGCGVVPFPTGNGYGLFISPATAPDCTWHQTAVFGSLNDPRHGGVPVSGRLTSVSVYGGSKPSPIRVTVIRQLGSENSGDKCCYFVSETDEMQPAANAVTTFPLNVPVLHHDITGGVLADDYVAITARTGDGTLTAPFRLVGNGDTSLTAFTTPGAVNAGFAYPRMGALANDAGGGRYDAGIANVEVLAQWTMCQTGDASCDPGATPKDGVKPAPAPPALVAQLARVQAGNALIRLACNGNVVCEGQLALINQSAISKAKKVTVYGKRSYKITAGKKATLKVKLNSKGKRLFRKGKRRARVALQLTPTGGNVTTSRITLKKP